MFLKNIYYYILISRSGLFDRKYYLGTYSDIRKADINPLWHFIRFGWKEGRNPSPFFNTEFYLRQNRDVFLAEINPLVHYICFGKKEGRNIDSSSMTSVGIRQNYSLAYSRFRMPWRTEALRNCILYLQGNISKNKKISHIIGLPFLSTGGAELVAMNFARVIYEKNKDCVLLITDSNRKDFEPDMPPNVVKISVDDFVHTGKSIDKKCFINDLILAIRPAAVHNINSVLLWELFMENGEGLREISRLIASIFSLQPNDSGKPDGYAELFLRGAIPHLSAILSDNQRFTEDAISEYNLQPVSKKFKFIYTPSRALKDENLNIANKRLQAYASNINQSEKLSCVWAGRLDREKRWDLFLELVGKCDFSDFFVYGRSVVDEKMNLPTFDNLNYMGGFITTEEIFLENRFDVFIFTSKWEGLPNILIEAGSWGVPIIAPNVGGVGELITNDTGFLLDEKPTYMDYINALDEIRNNPQEAVRRARNLMALISHRHSWTQFFQAVNGIPGYLE